MAGRSKLLLNLARSVGSVRFVRLQSTFRSIKKEIERFDSSRTVNSAHCPPGSWYVLDEFHKLDKRTVFANNWVAVCGAHHLDRPGDYVTGFLGDEPYLISKDYPNRVNYFYNVCRHHGTILCDAHKGHATEFVCPYHAWKYNLDGRLTMAKRLRHIENFAAKDYGLKQFSGTNWFGCLFLNQNHEMDEAAFHTKLDLLKSRLNEQGCSEENLVFVGSKTFPTSSNWKVAIDNYVDGGYHVPMCHPALNDLLDDDTYKTEVFDGFSIQSSSGTDSDSRMGSGTIFAHIYPNLFINRYGNWLDVNYVLPTGPETCDVVIDWYMDRGAYDKMDEQERHSYVHQCLKDSEKVQQEDIEICERVQKGMRSRSYTSGRYAPLLEHAMYDFHCRLAHDYKNITEV